MASADLMFTPAGELAARVRGGELSARELVQASLDRIGSLDGELNAFVEVDGERALAAADEIQPGDGRPFAGVPIAMVTAPMMTVRRLPSQRSASSPPKIGVR